MNIQKIEKFLKRNNGYITSNEIEQNGIQRIYIPELIKNGIIRRVSRGLYIDNKLIEDEYYILQKRYNNIIYSYNTAFHLLGISERAPHELDVTTYSHKRIRENVKIHYVSKEKLNIGKITITSPYGNPIIVYNLERCICDMLKNQNEYDIELYNKILKNYFNLKNKNLKLLDEYAKIFNVYGKLTTIMEVLIRW